MTPAVSKVHVIFKTHLDVGFTDSAAAVVGQYMTRYIPAALALARELREEGGEARFLWTTGSWLISEYLNQATPAKRRTMEAGIEAGDIAWHGLPFTTHTELMDPSLFHFGLTLAQDLDIRYGRRTIAAKMTDVPGHTLGMVPPMVDMGLRFLHIGVNPASRPPDVPDLFRWQHPDGSTLLVMYHKSSYGDVMCVPGTTEAIAFAHTGDNCGPQSAEQIRQAFAGLRARFPGAEVVASTLDAFARTLLPLAETLPLVTQEIGDTWIHGAGSDPWKVAAYRQLCRQRTEWLQCARISRHDPALARFSRALLLVPEHTWGMDEKTHLADYVHYARPDFEAARARDVVEPSAIPDVFAAVRRYRSAEPRFSTFEASWQEQRDYLTQAVHALPRALKAEAREALERVRPARTPREGYTPVRNTREMFATTHFFSRFDPETGAVNLLTTQYSDRKWADKLRPLGLLRYQTFSQADYDRYLATYNINMEHTWCSDWAIPDFSKPGLPPEAESRWWEPRLERLLSCRDGGDLSFLAELTFPEEAVTRYGAPAEVELEIFYPASRPAVLFNLQWFGKTASRLPEALWFSFVPRGLDPAGWRMDKMGTLISPLDVVRHGNRTLHAVQSGVYYQDAEGALFLETVDAPLLAPGDPALLTFTDEQPKLKHGWHVNLYNNVWGSNFPMWSADDGRFRFGVHIAESEAVALANRVI